MVAVGNQGTTITGKAVAIGDTYRMKMAANVPPQVFVEEKEQATRGRSQTSLIARRHALPHSSPCGPVTRAPEALLLAAVPIPPHLLHDTAGQGHRQQSSRSS